MTKSTSLAGKRFLTGGLIAALAIGLIGVPALSSCQAATDPLRGTERVHVILPKPHPAWTLAAGSAAPSYLVRWLDSDGDAREVSGVSSDVELELEAGTFTPIVMETESERAGIPRESLPLAGAMYPVHSRHSRGSTVIETNWMRGVDAVCAELVCLKAHGGYDSGHTIAAHFNWLRFDTELAKKANPFLVDTRSVADAILSGKVSVYDIKERKLFALAVARAPCGIPEGEAFIPAWPLAPSAQEPETPSAQSGALAAAEDGFFAVSCPAGISHWFGKDGVLTVNAENGKLTCAFFTRYGLRD